ncbi:ATP-binding protein [Azospirillum picis]|uniref:Anti-sigma regulatory factor (Ser/Thr protein kinase) n=1 Tax=Azospirillum picis TaxID=488438 RepID=A0ABU0MFB9_9PROT|nr:ATP-binding protein [Azospirillum picis]MBP2298247.1 anti-sigma regulatory factor (Ser/Thr protein kinase) [Azospirillum picis]MDQ0532084.1 anti-sigma regulatory factor (Ser/Thr protein kinase) [Azospirillum picis]
MPPPVSPPRAFSLLRDRVPADMAARLVARIGGIEVGEPDPGEPGGFPAEPAVEAQLIDRADRDLIRAAFGRSPFLTVELGEGTDGPAALLDDWSAAPAAEHPCRPGFYLSLTTGSAYGLQCAVLVCDELARRGVLDPHRRSDMELCLHEAVVNAIVHGNLGLSSAAKGEPGGYRRFSEMMRARLGDPAMIRRRLDIFCRWDNRSITIAVLDQGGGFDAVLAAAGGGGTARSGRGFVFMRALASRVTVTDGGRCTILQFDR